MVLGKKWKLQKKMRVEYVVHIQEIRPWPPSESLKSVQTVLLQWENGTENSGSFLSVAGDSNIVFNESFMLPVTLYHKKGGDKLRKNYLEFSLFAPRNDKPKKLLATAFLNLADYGLIEESSSTVRAPLSLRKSGNKSVEPALAVTLGVVERDTSNSSPSVGLSSLNNDDDDDDDDDYSEMASYTDDDDASSSRTAGSSIFEASIASPSRSDKNGCAKAGADHTRERKRNSWSSSTDQSSDTWNKVKDYVTSSKLTERSMSYAMKNSATPLIISSPTSTSFRDDNGKHNNITSKSSQQVMDDKLFERIAFEAMSADHLARHGVLMNEEQIMDETRQSPVTLRSNTFLSRKGQSVLPTSGTKARLKNLPSDIPNGSHKKGKTGSVIERKEPKGEVCDGKINEWKLRVEMLEDELREAAAMEVGLYSVLAEHSSSKTKVHAPARRLSRFYRNACKTGLQAKRASAAKAAVSGIVLVSKACGNDVPRLTFWLSNSIMLRSIISQIAAELPHSIAQRLNNNGDHTPDQSSVESDDFEDVLTFLISLERVESWLFSRIVESIWWQTFTPNMHPTITKSSNRERKYSGTKKGIGRRNSVVVIEHGSFAIELWKKAFKDACLKLCPIRAGGHECGCLSQLLILVMEQLVNRLDVAMFNSILRGSAQETMASDPVSDPISDSKVLPIPPGKSSFTAGAQLKNIIGNWSRWLSDLFGLEDEDSVVRGEKGRSTKSAFKAFRLLNALSDLMMLPFGMLADASSRKEVCPTFGPTIIKRVLNNFVPDEFSPNPIPRYLIDALTSQESSSDAWGESVNTYPCIATPTKYTAPPAALLTCVGEVGKQVLKSSRLATVEKSYRSDDELDEVDSPLTTIIPQSHQTISSLQKLSLMPKKMGGTNVVRFQMLREIWRDG